MIKTLQLALRTQLSREAYLLDAENLHCLYSKIEIKYYLILKLSTWVDMGLLTLKELLQCVESATYDIEVLKFYKHTLAFKAYEEYQCKGYYIKQGL
jgi:hypothetical protein